MTSKAMNWAVSLVLLCLLLAGTAGATSYTLTVNTNGSGTVNRNPSNSTYPSGVVVTVTATPSAGWYFSGWTGDAVGTLNPTNVTMDANKVITGNFQQIPPYTLTLVTNGQGTISLNPGGGTYLSNTVVTVTAAPSSGWTFVAWSGSTNVNTNPLSITMNTNNSLAGTFAQLPAFDVQPQSISNAIGSTASFSAHAVGTAPLSYQWFFANGSISSATNNTLTLTNVSADQAGNYWIIATNNYASATSSVVLLALTNLSGSTNVVNSPDEASLRAAIKIGGWVGLGFNGTITLANTISITNNVILDAHNVSATISGGNAVRLFYVAPGVTFCATNLTLANGSCIVTSGTPGTPADAGAIYNDGGTVTLVSCTVTNNSAQSLIYGGLARGGAIFNNGGTLSLFQTTISNNATIGGGSINEMLSSGIGTGLGGAIFNTSGSVTIVGCNVSSNLCSGLCFGTSTSLAMGGAAFQSSGSITISNSVFAYNLALGGVAAYLDQFSGPAYGGALAATGGSITIDYSQFFENTAKGGDAGAHDGGGPSFGGAVYSAAILAVTDSSLYGNQALAGNYTLIPQGGSKGVDGSGGAIYNVGTAVLNRCSVYSNGVQGGIANYYLGYVANGGNGLGGGIFNASQFTITNCTVALNSAVGGNGQGQSAYYPGAGGNGLGGGVFNNTNASFIAMNVTIATNSCSSPSGSSFTNGLAAGVQIANTSGTLALINSIIAYGGTNGNAYGIITDDGFNFSSDGSAEFASGSSYNFTDPQLAPLGDYGGPTLCMALLANSPAIDYGDDSGAPATDQRGFFRPYGSSVDAGAYEYGSYLFSIPYLNITAVTNTVVITYTAYPSYSYRLQASTNLTSWVDLQTNGPFASQTNVNNTVSVQGWSSRFFRLLAQ